MELKTSTGLIHLQGLESVRPNEFVRSSPSVVMG